MLLRKGLALSFLTVVYLLAFSDARACTCLGPRNFVGKNFQPCSVYWASDVVFTGRVEKITYEKVNGRAGINDSRMTAHFSVDKSIRGVEGNSVDVETSSSTASCGYPFKEAERYFVYVRKGADGRLTQHLCDPTVLLKDAEPDLEYLKAVEAGEEGGRVYGNVFRLLQASFRDSPSSISLVGAKIKLTSVNVIDATQKHQPRYIRRSFETTTDRDGYYIFMGIPNGMYKVEATLPRNLRMLARSSGVPPHYVTIDEGGQRCGSANFETTSLASLEGRVINQDGSTPPQQYIWLLPVDESGKVLLDYYAYTWITNGKYHFDTVAPGSYVLAVNPKGCPNKYYGPEYGPSFFPGVGTLVDATQIFVKDAEEKTANPFKLLPPLRERLFTGTVVTPDGMPVPGATVFLNEADANKCMVLSSLDESVTNDLGEFRLKGYEGFQYKLRAYIESKNSSSGRLYSDLIDISAVRDNGDHFQLILSHEY
jgi:hypothetical protein